MVYAVDARTGKERWRWDPQVNRSALQPVLCCGAVLRGLALYQGKIIAPILDGRLDALDAETGKWVWEARVAFPQDMYTITMASMKRLVGVKYISHSSSRGIPPEPPVAGDYWLERRGRRKGAPQGAATRTLAAEHRSSR